MCTARIGRREIQGRYDNILKGGKFLNFEVGEGRFQKIKLMKKFWGDRIKQRLMRYASNICNFLLKSVNGSLVLKREPFVSKNALSLFITDKFSSFCLCFIFC